MREKPIGECIADMMSLLGHPAYREWRITHCYATGARLWGAAQLVRLAAWMGNACVMRRDVPESNPLLGVKPPPPTEEECAAHMAKMERALEDVLGWLGERT